MRPRHSALLLILILGLSASVLVSAKKKPAAAQMDGHKRALHALNRLAFGPRPGEVERVAAIGVDKWIEQQLHPERIEDHALEARLADFSTLKMSTMEMVEKFPPPQLVKQVVEGKRNMPRDPKERAIYESQVDAYRDRQESKQAKSEQDPNNPSADASADQRAAMRDARMEADAKAQELLDLPPDERFQEILKMSPEERRMLARGLPPDDRQRVMQEFTPQQRETVMAMVSPPLVITTELQQAKILRAAYSERQLEEVMTDFWLNHFNVFMGKGADRYLLTAYERDVIRPHALGKFRDLLEATAKSPAMLFYLDNWLSVGPHSDVALGRPPRGPYRRVYRGPFGVPVYRPPRPPNPNAQQRKNKREGLNENYARELMELHTLSVNGGYTQGDVTEVAKVFTGWTIKRPRQGGGFEFNQRLHEPGPKYVLGKVIKERGEKEGEQVLDMLAKSPKTAHFISYKLAQRFVSDDPPPALVDRMAATFLKKDGDIREVLRTLFQSPEFWSPEAYRAKVKTPLEFVVSAVRASGVEVENAMPLVQVLNRMGMPLYGAQPPTGYSMKAETWVNSAALLNRMNFALALGTGRLRGLNFDADRILLSSQVPQDRSGALAALETSLLAGDVSKNTHDTILKQMDDPKVTGLRLDDSTRPPNVGVLAGLLMGSPEFQRR
jgi:uncharacterized protein (DUF1800 family)